MSVSQSRRHSSRLRWAKRLSEGGQSLKFSAKAAVFKRVRRVSKEFDWNGDVATRVDMRTTKVKFFKKYLFEGTSDPGKIIRRGR